MNDPNRISRLGEASCRNLRWFFDVCAESDMDPQQLVRDVPYSFEHLSDPGRFIDWRSYSNFISNFRRFVSADELTEFARITSYPWSLRVWYSVLARVRSITEVYYQQFGSGSQLSRMYPCRTDVAVKASGNLVMTLTMLPGHEPCEAFHFLIKGQVAGLATVMGAPSSDVTMTQGPAGASFRVTFEDRTRPLVRLRRLLEGPFARLWSVTQLQARFLELRNQNLRLREEVETLRQSEAVATQTESRYRLLATHSTDVIWTLSRDLRFQFLSPSITTLSGYSPEEAMDLPLDRLFTTESYEHIVASIEAGLNTQRHQPQNYELQLVHKNSNLRWLEVTARYLVDEDGQPTGVVGIARDITERKAMQLELAEREENYRIITQTARDGIVTLDAQYRILFANPALASMFGFTANELAGRQLTELVPDMNQALVDADNPAEALSGECLTAMRKDGSLVPVEISFARHSEHGSRYLTGILRDVTQRRRVEAEREELERQLQASQRMESIGQLTGGIAHDFNNLLVAILGYTDLALNPDLPEHELRTFLTEIRSAGKRAADMTHKLLTFSRRQIIEPALIDLNELVSGLDLMIRRLIPENIDVGIERATRLSPVLADAGQLEQVVVNLSVNARDAMADGGQLTISTAEVDVPETLRVTNPWAQPGRHTMLRITDTGSGMSEDVQRRVFEPFFTTKPEGAGTGLGLAVVFGIVEQHKGFIDVDSEPGRGTRFSVYLPVASPEDAAAASRRPRAALGGDETILIVEDDPQVAQLARLILHGGGYQTLVASDGHEALRLFGAHKEEIDLVLLDVVMPRMGGREVMRRMLARDAEQKILFTSGYSANGIHTSFILEDGLEFIAKPYSTNALRGKVRALLDRRVDTEADTPLSA